MMREEEEEEDEEEDVEDDEDAEYVSTHSPAGTHRDDPAFVSSTF